MYSSLHNHSYFSCLDGYGSPKEMLDRAKEVGLKAIAVTEHGNVYSHIYYDLLKKDYPDIKVIYGCELYECDDIKIQDKNNKYFHLIALCKNEQGRKDLNKIITKSNFEGFYFKPRCTVEDIKPYSENLIVTSACLAGRIARENDFNKCVELINNYKSIFPYFYLEMQSHKHSSQVEYNRKILELSELTDTPFIITTDSHVARKEDLYYQDKLIKIGRNSANNDKNAIENSEIYDGCYIQSEDEIHQIMDEQIGHDNVCIGLNNTNEISDMIDIVDMPFQKPILPNYPLPEGYKTEYDFLCHLIEEGWYKKGFDKLPLEPSYKGDTNNQKTYRERIDKEMKVIHDMKYDGYFIIVWDFINAAIKLGVEVGKGRGSAAGSLVCYLTDITDIDPIKNKLIFERFLNPERVGLPDIDTDVGDRDIVINYLLKKYGESRVCQIINFSYLTPTVAIIDAGKILGIPYAKRQKLSQKFTGKTWEECLKNNPGIIEDNTEFLELFDIASHLSGRVKTVSIHAGGVGIVNTDISDFMAMKLGSKNEHVIQVDKHYIENIGIVKFDILGVSTLNLIGEVKKDVNIDPWDININNEKFIDNRETYRLLSSGKTDGVFQVESAGMKDLLIRLHPETSKDFGLLSDILALYRPDSMGALENYIEIKTNNIKPKYIHPDMADILDSTHGALIYQEQIMEIVRHFGGRSLGGADIFRKAIGKKNKELVLSETNKLKNEILNNNFSEDVANYISDSLSQKGGYCFNKSHSVSYAVLCFLTAWLKTHYTVYFFKALFNQNKDNAGALNIYILDAKYFNVEILPPNINKSEINFTVYENKILFGLSAISGIGETLAKNITIEREKNGDFSSFNDLISRVNLTKLQIISLIKAGAVPCKNKKTRLISYLKSLYVPLKYKEVSSLPTYFELSNTWNIDLDEFIISSVDSKRKKYDKENLLKVYNSKKKELFDSNQSLRYEKYISDNSKYLEDEEFWEFQTLQIFINNNPFERAYKYLVPFEDIEIDDKCVIAGVISKVQKKKDKKGNQFAFFNIYSVFGIIEAICWHEQFKANEDIIKKGCRVSVLCTKISEDKILVSKMKKYDEWINRFEKMKVSV